MYPLFSIREEAQMGKSLNVKDLGAGITQHKDGLYQGRFTNRFGKKVCVKVCSKCVDEHFHNKK